MRKIDILKPTEPDVIIGLSLRELGTIVAALGKSTDGQIKIGAAEGNLKTVLGQVGDPTLKLYQELKDLYSEVAK